MSVRKSRWMILALSLLAVVLSVIWEGNLVTLLLSSACLLGAVMILYRHMGELSGISQDNPKIKTLRLVTVFDVLILLLCVGAAMLAEAGIVGRNETADKYFAAALILAIILFLGNLSPKLPFTRHTGLRLPWTVTDEETWIVAHRILGYISLPLALVYRAGIPAVSNFKALSITVILLWIGIPSGLSLLFYLRKFQGVSR